MKRPLMQTALLITLISLAGASALAGQLPSPAQPVDELPGPPASQSSSEPPLVALVESILAGEDDPLAWAALEVALGEDGQSRDEDASLATGGAEPASRWTSFLASARGYATAVNWTPELLLILGVVGLLTVAGAGVLVGAFRRRHVPHRSPHEPRRRLRGPGRRRPSRAAGAACRDAARLEARMKRRRAA